MISKEILSRLRAYEPQNIRLIHAAASKTKGILSLHLEEKHYVSFGAGDRTARHILRCQTGGHRNRVCRWFRGLVLAMIGVKPGNIPFDVISIIMAVIAAISAMQVAGGMDYLVHQTEKLLRKNPKYITILAPIVTYFLTIFAGTGNISLSALPVIAEVAKEQGIKPCRPLSTAVVSAQIAITASPISAAVVYMSSVMEGHGISYIHLLMVVIPSTFLAVLVMSLIVSWCFDSKLSDDPVYQKRLAEGLIELRGDKQVVIKPRAKSSVWLFLLGVVCVVCYAIINSPSLGLVENH